MGTNAHEVDDPFPVHVNRSRLPRSKAFPISALDVPPLGTRPALVKSVDAEDEHVAPLEGGSSAE